MGGLLSQIAAGPRPVEIDPTLALKRRIMLADMQAQQAERMAQAQTLQQKAQEQQAAFQDQTALRRAFTESNGDFDKLPELAISYGARVPAVQAAQQSHETLVTGLLGNAKTQNELAMSHHEQLSRAVDGISQLPPEQRDAAMSGFWQKAQQWLPPQELQTAQQTFGSTDDKTLQAFKATLDYGGNLAKEAIERQTAQAKTTEAATGVAKENREAVTSAAALPGVQAEAEKKQMITDLMKQSQTDPSKGLAAIDLALDPKLDPQTNTALKAAYQAMIQSGNVEGAAGIVKTAAEHTASLSDAARQKKVADAISVEKATTPLKIQQAVATARAMNGTGAVANVPPHLAPTAIADYQKSGTTFANALTHAEEVQKVLDMASSGNKAAGANVPLVGVGALNAINGIKRINSAEIAQYGTAGSLLDKIQGKLKGWTEGQPIPNDVLNDMKALHAQLAQGASMQHTREVQSINQAYGSNFAPMKFDAANNGPATVPDPVKKLLSSATVNPGIHTLTDGSKWMKAADGTISKQ